MSFKLEGKESFNDSFRRIVLEQVDKAVSALSLEAEDLDKSVHDARVCIKKIRALLRLGRHSLGKELFATEDRSVRDIGRLLSSARNPAAMLEVVDLVDERADDPGTKGLIQTVRGFISESKELDEEKRAAAMSEAREELCKLKPRIENWPEVSVDLSFKKGLRRVFKTGRSSLAEAYEAHTVDAFHEWRKHVKYLLYQGRMLRPIWPRYMKALLADLKTIGQLLSDDHDLALFRKMISEMDLGEEEGKRTEDLFELIDSRRLEVEQEARSLGNRIYTEKPGSFARRMHTYWKEWHRG